MELEKSRKIAERIRHQLVGGGRSQTEKRVRAVERVIAETQREAYIAGAVGALHWRKFSATQISRTRMRGICSSKPD